MTTSQNSRRERKKAETEQRIVESAVRVFKTKGFADATVEEITEAADVGKGTFFNYFRSKEHILLGIMEQAGRQFDTLAASAERDHSAPNLIRAFAHRFLSHPTRTPLLLRNILGIAMAHAALRRPLLLLIMRIRKNIVRVIAAGQQRGEIRTDIPAAELARSFQQFMLGTQIMWSLDEQDKLLDRVDQIIDIFFRGVAAAPARSAPRAASGKEARR